MKQFFKENFVLITGISLPLFLAAIFFMATIAPLRGIAPPRTPVVYAANYLDYNENPWHFVVRNGTLFASYTAPAKAASSGTQPVLHLYDPKSGADKILALPQIMDAAKAEAPVADAKGLKMTTMSPSPDGYTFERDYHSDANIMSDIFGGGSSYTDRYVLRKDGYRKPVPMTDNYNTQFIGWVVP